MKTSIAISLMISIIAAVISSHILLSSAINAIVKQLPYIADRSTSEEIAALRKEMNRLSAERTRISRLLAKKDISSFPILSTQDTSEHLDGDSRAVTDEKDLSEFNSITTPLLSEDSYALLLHKRDKLSSPHPSDSILLLGDMDALLKDAQWNIAQREITADERSELTKLLRRYAYFARTSMSDMVETTIKPEVKTLASAGAYIEYDWRDPNGLPSPVEIDGTTIMSVSGPSESEDVRRLYYFYPQDYPQLYHQTKVEAEQSLKSYIDIYELINGSSTFDDK